MRATLITKEEIAGSKRKLVWLNTTSRGFYFDTSGFFLGSHTSYHVDGNVFRTSPATNNRPKLEGRYVPLENFRGWHQFGISMLQRKELHRLPSVSGRDRKKGNIFSELLVEQFPAPTLNIVFELAHRSQRHLLNRPELQPHKGAIISIFEIGELLAILTVFGHRDNLLIQPTATGFKVSHHSSRYSANAQGVNYSYEAYGERTWKTVLIGVFRTVKRLLRLS